MCRSSRRTRWWGSAPSWPPTQAQDTCTMLSTPLPPEEVEQRAHGLFHPGCTSSCWRGRSATGGRRWGRGRPSLCPPQHSWSGTFQAICQGLSRLQGQASTLPRGRERVEECSPKLAAGRAPPSGPSASSPLPCPPPLPSWQR